MTLNELNQKYAPYISRRHSDYLKRDFVHFDVDKVYADKGALIFRAKCIPSIANMKVYLEITNDLAEWRMAQGRVEYGAKMRDIELSRLL